MFSTVARQPWPLVNLPSPPSQERLCGQRIFESPPRSKPFSNARDQRRDSSCRILPPFNGLKTPPTDDMSAACQQQQPLGPYDPHALSTYPPSVFSQPERTKSVLSEAIFQSHQQQQSRYHSHPQPQPQPQPQSRLPPLEHLESRAPPMPMPRPGPGPVADVRSSVAAALDSKQLSRSSTPSSVATMASQSKESMSKQLTGHSSDIPEFISPRGGSLADFVAQMSCFFWFEQIEVLRTAEKVRVNPATPVRRLHPDSTPHAAFKKWCYSILNTTQVTRNVILLALLFIYRLKKLNPGVKGRPGSEYRLVTVALMLGNKFLDDNTYTNKTWADVSMLSVTDIHLMEVEFLSNMRYSLLTTKEEWESWLGKLGSFYEYYEGATALAATTPTITIPSPPHNLYRSPIASPTVCGHGHTPSTPTIYSPGPVVHSNGQNWVSASSPLSNRPSMGVGNGRKRSFDGDVTEPPAKRAAHGQYPAPAPLLSTMARLPTTTAESVRLPVPSLSINTNAAMAMPTPVSSAYTPTSSLTPGGHVSLPPLVPGVRAMATVYPQTTGPMQQQQHQHQQQHQQHQQHQQQQLPAPVPVSANMMASASYSASGLPPHPALGYSTPTKTQNQANMPLYNSSPLAESYQPGSGVHTPVLHTPMSNSPSIYLQQRPSPYKPVRHVNTLLCPPPSASLQEYHLAVPPSQMHYQPLGRRNDLRTGIVPEFMPPFRGNFQGHPPPATTHGGGYH